MAIISNFPAERDWGEFIDALALEIMQGVVELPLETRSGKTLRTRADAQMDAYEKNSYANLMNKPTINGIELGSSTTGEALNLVSTATFYELVQRVAALEKAILEFAQTDYLISRAAEN